MKLCIIPQPQEFLCEHENVFKLTRLCEFQVAQGCENAFEDFCSFCEEAFHFEFLGTGKESISLSFDSNLKKSESYTLDVTENSIVIKGADKAGVFYGIQSLKQLFLQTGEALPEIHVKDEPAFSYRGFMLDVGRYFFTKEAVMLLIDMMAFHKLNCFHWHLTEDQGWRAELLDNALLTQIGAYRSHTNFNKTPHGGFYTKDEMKEIVRYAHKKHIKVIPEIDSPGHVVSAIAAYPHLSCFDRDLEVATHWGVKSDVLCVGKESTFDFMFSVFDELLEVFTDGLIHIGGDEVPTVRWKLCPHCQKRMKDEGFEDESELHGYYLDRIASHIKAKGSQVIMWNDKMQRGMADKSIARQLWNSDMSETDVAKGLNEGMKFVISTSDAYYLNYPHALTNLEKCYEFYPEYKGTKEDKKKNILGVEACLWTEFIPSMKDAGYYTFPRLGAFSETAWTKKENKSFSRFTEKLDSYYYMLSCYGLDFANKKQAMPNSVRKAASKLYWERRKLCWHGLHNQIDNAIIERTHKGEKKDD